MISRAQHNATLGTEFLKKRGVTSLFPPVHLQRTHIPVNRRALSPQGYNPSILQHGNRLLMPYRWHQQTSWHTRLSMAELDDKFNVIKNREIEIPGSSVEDPRLFLFNGVPWISFTVSS